MVTTTSIKIGDVKQLNLAVSPAGSNLAGLTYRVVPTGIVSLAINSTGVKITGLKDGAAKVYADVNGLDSKNNPAVIEAECDVTVKGKGLIKKIVDWVVGLFQ